MRALRVFAEPLDGRGISVLMLSGAQLHGDVLRLGVDGDHVRQHTEVESRGQRKYSGCEGLDLGSQLLSASFCIRNSDRPVVPGCLYIDGQSLRQNRGEDGDDACESGRHSLGRSRQSCGQETQDGRGCE